MKHFCLLIICTLVGCAQTEVTRITAQITVNDTPANEVIAVFWPVTDINLGSYQTLVREGQLDISPRPQRSRCPGQFKLYFRVPMGPMSLERKVTPIPEPYTSEDNTPLRFELVPGINELEPVVITTKTMPTPRDDNKPMGFHPAPGMDPRQNNP